MHILRYRFFISLLLILAGTTPVQAGDWHIETPAKVVALSDVHGAYDAMVATLQQAGIVDDLLAWSGGDAHLVIVGDILDRGPRSRDVMDLLMRLENEATVGGGRVHVLIGNHESMNMIGDMRYVSKDEYAAFAGDETAQQRDRWFEAYLRRNGKGAPEALRERFDATYPPGYFALREAFGPSGRYGSWLLEKPVMVVINRTAFVHGGLSPLVAEIGLDGVNGGLRRQLADYVAAVAILMDAGILLPTDNYYDHAGLVQQYMASLDEPPAVLAALATVRELARMSLFTSEGPLWYRGNVACSPVIETHRVDAALSRIDADRVVVGHTPTPGREVLQRLGGRVVEVDTGMLGFYYNGTGHALVLQDGRLSVFNQVQGAVSGPVQHQRSVGSRPDDLSSAALEELLLTGEIVAAAEKDAFGRAVVSVSDGRQEVNAVFVKRRSGGVYPETAAYRLDRLVGLDMVPVTVKRQVGGNDGSLQFLPEKLLDERERAAAGRGNGASCPLPDQWAAMYVFDALAHNDGRSPASMLYEPGRWQLMLTRHGDAFAAKRGLPRYLANASFEVSEGWRRVLRGLTDEVLDAQLGDVLDERRLRLLGTRRDELRGR